MSDEQLALTLKDEAVENLFRMRLQAQTETARHAPSELRKTRRLIARVKTIQTERAKAGGRQLRTTVGTVSAMPKKRIRSAS